MVLKACLSEFIIFSLSNGGSCMAASLPTGKKCAMFLIMNKPIFLSLLLVLVRRQTVFWHSYLRRTKRSVACSDLSVNEGDYSKARAYLHQLKKSSPRLDLL